MEESEQRRERLKAMRMEASRDANTNDGEGGSSFHGLSNPLIETPTAQGHMGSYTQRFDFYTDPMAAFSGAKKGSNASPQIPTDYSTPPRMWNQDLVTSTDHQPHINLVPKPGMQPPQGPYGNPSGMASPTPGFWNGSAGTHSYPFPSNSPRTGNFPSPGFVQGSSHSLNRGQGRGYQHPHSPRPGFQQEGSPNFNPGQGSGYQFNNSPQPGFGQEGNPSLHSGQGRGPRFNSSPMSGSGSGSGIRQGYSPISNSGQGRGQFFNNNSSPAPNSGRGRGRWTGQSGGRGRGYNSSHVTAEERPDLFYNKSMVEDPWKPLKPIIWKTINVRAPSMNNADSPYSWLPKSIATKRAKVEGGPSQTSSQPSLAEYLAASFNEAADDEPSE